MIFLFFISFDCAQLFYCLLSLPYCYSSVPGFIYLNIGLLMSRKKHQSY